MGGAILRGHGAWEEDVMIRHYWDPWRYQQALEELGRLWAVGAGIQQPCPEPRSLLGWAKVAKEIGPQFDRFLEVLTLSGS